MDETQALATTEQPKTQLVASTQTFGGLMPRNLDELWRMATWIAKSGMAPKGLSTPEAISVAIQMGLEVGLSPMQSVQNIAVINGRPAIWGDAALALCRASGELEVFKEWKEGEPFTDGWTAHCELRRKGDEENTVETFSYKEAKAAKLVPAHPDSPWAKYPKRMLQMRARSWPLRDKFADVLKGLQVREEASDVVVMESRPDGSFEAKPEPVSGKEAMKEKLRKKTPEPAQPDPAETAEKASKAVAAEIPREDTAKAGEAPKSTTLEPGAAQTDAIQKQPKMNELTEVETYDEFKNMKKPGFVEWLTKNYQNRDTWTLFISRAVDTKCKTIFGNTFEEVLPEIKAMAAPSPAPPTQPDPPPTPQTLAGKIIRIEDLLHREYSHIGATTRQDWMQASWDCDLEALKGNITDKIADDILDDLSDPIRSTLTTFART